MGAYPDDSAKLDKTEYGKPFVKNRTGYEFNLSHSGRLIAFAEDDAPVGVDVELVKEKDYRLFHRYLNTEEMSMIESSSDPEACFFEIWTVREAFAKEEGLGLGILDKQFSVDYKSRRISYDGRVLYFKSFDRFADERYKISVCSVHDVSDAVLTELTPADWEQRIESLKQGINYRT